MTTEDVPGAGRIAHFGQLSPQSARNIDEICDCFEHQLYVQGRPRIEDLLGGFSEPERTILLRELLLLELETYLSRDTFADQEKYRRRFPEHAALVREVFEALFPSPAPTHAKAEQSWPEIPNYRILRRLNEGGMGKVYEAIHTRLGTPVALKVLREDLARDPAAEARFEREMKVIGTLSHPNIVVARDAGRWAGRYYLVMEYVQGLDLEGILERLGTLPVPEACEIARRVASALQYAHEHRLVHRDIKPQNVLLGRCPPNSEEIQVKVVDFGVSLLPGYQSLRDPAVQCAHVLGTFAYMAPEQYWDQTADIRSDVYSLGCTLHCLLLGRPPFSRPYYQDSLRIMAAHRHEPVPSFRRLRPDVSQPLERLILSTMAKDPKDRPQTPAELARSLSPFAEGHDLPGLLSRAKSLPPLTPIAHLLGSTEPTESAPSGAHVLVNEPAPQQQTTAMAEDAGQRDRETPADERVNLVDPGPRVSSAPSGRPGDEEPESLPPGSGRTPPRRLVYALAAAGVIALAILAAIVGPRMFKPSPVDLLVLVKPDRDSVGDLWEFEGPGLISPDAPLARLQIPYSPPAEYDLKIDAERVSGGKLAIGLVWQGQQTPVVLNVTVVPADSPATEKAQPVVTALPEEFHFAGAPRTYTCIVRRDGFLVAYEDQVRFSCLPGDEPPRIDAHWQTPDRNVLSLGTDNSVYHFRKIVLTPVD